jgi:hypothetical protein
MMQTTEWNRSAIVLGVLAVAFLMAPAPRADAALGGDLASVEKDKAELEGELSSQARADYVVHELQVSNGGTVREFASPTGTVFGVAWSGPFLPDMTQLMGRYFDTYARAAAQSHRRGRAPLVLHLPGLEFVNSGHPRSFHGHAYVPELVPAGVDASEIR